MKKSILIKHILGIDSVKQDSITGVTQSLKDPKHNRIDGNSLTAAKTESKVQPNIEFRYSQRCYCGIN